jgi:molybdopterin synthase catalytic subunit
LKQIAAFIAMSVNQEYAGRDTKLKSGDEVALLPPVSGGLDEAELPETRPPNKAALEACGQVRLVREKISTHEVAEQLKQPEDGAAVIFEGIVRNNTRGRRTLFLDYECYEEMAIKQMRALTQQAVEQFKVRDVALIHRLGKLEIGETSVLIVVASAHRGAAFDACRWLIDTLKRTVPIWKKEHFEDGAVWADGEPFPAAIPKAEGSHSEMPASK